MLLLYYIEKELYFYRKHMTIWGKCAFHSNYHIWGKISLFLDPNSITQDHRTSDHIVY